MRMKLYFDLPINGDDVSCLAYEDELAEAAHAINCHDELVAELKNMRDRFHNMLVGTGTAPEFATAAVASADAILKKAKGA